MRPPAQKNNQFRQYIEDDDNDEEDLPRPAKVKVDVATSIAVIISVASGMMAIAKVAEVMGLSSYLHRLGSCEQAVKRHCQLPNSITINYRLD